MNKKINLTKVTIDCKIVNEFSIIKQLSEYRKALNITQQQVAEYNKGIFGSMHHVSNLERMCQRENSEHIIEYAKALGIKEIKFTIQ